MEKYSLVERERKFLIDPLLVPVNGLAYKTITDHYITGTAIRFRKVVDDQKTVYKLTKKVPFGPGGETNITTIYLSEQEYALLNIFEAVKVQKVRYLMPLDPFVVALDKYANTNEELWIAEVEFTNLQDLDSFNMPLPFLKEVTLLEEFNGFELAKRFQTS